MDLTTITHNLTLSTTDFNLVGDIKVRQSDDETIVFDSKILEHGLVKNFDGLKPFFCLMAREITGQGVSEEPVTVYDETKGTLKYTVSANAMQMVGRNEAYFSFRKELTNGSWAEQFSTRSFYYTVEKSIYTQPFKDSNYWFTFKELYRLFNEYIDSGKLTWEDFMNTESDNWKDFIDQNREIIESIDPGGEVLSRMGIFDNFRTGDYTVIEKLKNESYDRGVNVKWFVKGDGTDETVALQEAIDEAKRLKLPLINNDKNLRISISKPVYVDDGAKIDLGFATIVKTTNDVGVGSNTYNGRVDYYSVDAFVIVRHPNNFYATEIDIRNINFERTAANRVRFGIHALRLARSKMANIWSKNNTTDICAFGQTWFLMPEFSNIRQDAGETTWLINDDGSSTGGSTSIIASQIVGYDQKACYSLYGVSYSVINTPLIDRITSGGTAFDHNMCPGLTVNSPSVEISQKASFIRFIGTKGVVNSPRILYNKGAIDTDSDIYTIYCGYGSNIIINSGDIGDYEDHVAAKNFPVFIQENSNVVLNNVKLPSNGNSYMGLTGNSTVQIVSSEGSFFRDSTGVGQKVNGLRRFTGTSQPSTGTWKAGEEIINSNKTNGIEKWICITGGTPGTWKAAYIEGFEKSLKQFEITGDGSKTQFSFVHGLGKEPTAVAATALNYIAGNADLSYCTVDATNVGINFRTAIPNGQKALVSCLFI